MFIIFTFDHPCCCAQTSTDNVGVIFLIQHILSYCLECIIYISLGHLIRYPGINRVTAAVVFRSSPQNNIQLFGGVNVKGFF